MMTSIARFVLCRCLSLCVYAYMCMRICVCVYAYASMCMLVCVCIFVYAYLCMLIVYAYMCMLICVCVCVYACMCMLKRVCLYVYAHVEFVLFLPACNLYCLLIFPGRYCLALASLPPFPSLPVPRTDSQVVPSKRTLAALASRTLCGQD